MNLIKNTDPEVSDSGKTKEKVLFLVGALILIGAGFYWFWARSSSDKSVNPPANSQPVLEIKPDTTERGIAGEIAAVNNEAKNISVRVFEDGGKSYTVSVASTTAVVRVKAGLNKTSETKAGFSSLAPGQTVNVTYEKGDIKGNAILAKKIEIIEFMPPPAGNALDSYPEVPPGQ